MNKLLNFSDYNINKDAGVKEFENYINEALESNRDRIITYIKNGHGETIIDKIVDQLMQHAFSNYSKETLLRYIANGVMVEAQQRMTNKFLNDKHISLAIQDQMAVI